MNRLKYQKNCQGGYTDNFAIGNEEAEAFAGEIQAAAGEQNLEMLAELAAYPLYIGFTDGSVSVNAPEELISLGAERIFTEEMISSIEGADISSLSPSMAGFSVSKNGRPNIVFGVRDGRLAIQGMNY